MTIELPPGVAHKVAALAESGRAWVDELDAVVAELADRWSLTIGQVLTGGSGAVVVEVARGNRPAVLKLSIPDGLDGHSEFAVELDALLLGDRDAYVEVIDFDREARALLLERLGRPLAELDLAVDSQITAIATTLRRGWISVDASCGLRSGADQAESLIEFIERWWDELGRPCAARVAGRARDCLDARLAAFDDAATVLVHGDAHPHNVLQVPETDRYKLIDPDGMRSEPSHDLAIPLRDWSAELLDATDPLGLARAWCGQLADLGGTAFDAVWQWAYAERVSTGLFATRLGHPIGGPMLATAQLLVDG